MTSPPLPHVGSADDAHALTDDPPSGILRSPRRVLFGAGQRHHLGEEVARLGSRVLVCTDPWVSSTPEFAAMLDDLRGRCAQVRVFDRASSELPTSDVALSLGTAAGSDVDVVVGVGGGTCIDLAKATALLLRHPGPLSRYYGENKVPGPVTPLVAVPTTGGTGSEVTPVCVLTDATAELKVGISDPALVPETAICDPQLTRTCPPALTASVGADALSHLVESFTAVRRTADSAHGRVFIGKNDLSDHWSRWGLQLMARSLVRAVVAPDDVARGEVMLAAHAGGYALGVAGTAAAHAIQYPVGALTKTPHGVGVGALLPYVMEFNLPVRTEEMAEIGELLGVGTGSLEARAHAGVEKVARLLEQMGVPPTLAALGVAEGDASWIGERGLRSTRLVENNPRPLDEDAVRRIVLAAVRGVRSGLAE